MASCYKNLLILAVFLGPLIWLMYCMIANTIYHDKIIDKRDSIISFLKQHGMGYHESSDDTPCLVLFSIFSTESGLSPRKFYGLLKKAKKNPKYLSVLRDRCLAVETKYVKRLRLQKTL